MSLGEKVFVECRYQTLSSEMDRLTEVLPSDFAMGALQALAWIRDGAASPSDTLRGAPLDS